MKLLSMKGVVMKNTITVTTIVNRAGSCMGNLE